MSIKASLGCSSVNSTDISDRINIIFKVDSCNICPVFFYLTRVIEVVFIFRNLDHVEGKMKKIGKGLSEVDAKVKRLEVKYNKTLEEKAMLTIEHNKAEETIVVAENLVGKLEGEYQRWSGQACSISTLICTTGLVYSHLFL